MDLHNKKIYFIHNQKCAGTFIWSLIKKQYPINSFNNHHASINNNHNVNSCADGGVDGGDGVDGGVDGGVHDKETFIIGNIRNPYKIYVSLWAYGCYKKGALFNYFNKHHQEYLYLYSDVYNIQHFKTWCKLILQYNIILKKNIFFQDTDVMKYYNIGIVTYRFITLYYNGNFNILHNDKINNEVDIFIKVENMINDLQKINIHITEDQNENGKIKSNSTTHLDYQLYYDDELRNLVYLKDFYIFKRFQYDF